MVKGTTEPVAGLYPLFVGVGAMVELACGVGVDELELGGRYANTVVVDLL